MTAFGCWELAKKAPERPKNGRSDPNWPDTSKITTTKTRPKFGRNCPPKMGEDERGLSEGPKNTFCGSGHRTRRTALTLNNVPGMAMLSASDEHFDWAHMIAMKIRGWKWQHVTPRMRQHPHAWLECAIPPQTAKHETSFLVGVDIGVATAPRSGNLKNPSCEIRATSPNI